MLARGWGQLQNFNVGQVDGCPWSGGWHTGSIAAVPTARSLRPLIDVHVEWLGSWEQEVGGCSHSPICTAGLGAPTGQAPRRGSSPRVRLGTQTLHWGRRCQEELRTHERHPEGPGERRDGGTMPDFCFRKEASFVQVERESPTPRCEEACREAGAMRLLEAPAAGRWNLGVLVTCPAQGWGSGAALGGKTSAHRPLGRRLPSSSLIYLCHSGNCHQPSDTFQMFPQVTSLRSPPPGPLGPLHSGRGNPTPPHRLTCVAWTPGHD